MKWHPFFLFLLALLSACSPPPAPTTSPIPTLLPTATPVPEPISGTIFRDANGSGLMDETSFIVPAYDPTDPPYFFELLAANGTDIAPFIPGELATVPEPPILGIGVCLDEVCTETDASGAFTLQPEKDQDTNYLKFTDPNTDDPTKAFRYINKWNGTVVIESYEINGIRVPEQHLNDTEILNLKNELKITNNSEIKLGLMQGFLTIPFSRDYFVIYNWVDYDPRLGSIEIYTGFSDFDSDTYQYKAQKVIPSITDGHNGVDYRIKKGSLVFASIQGEVIETFLDSTNDGGILADSRIAGERFRISYWHQNRWYISNNEFIYRGQQISSPMKFDELHSSIFIGNEVHEPCIYFKENRDDKSRRVDEWASILDPYRDVSNLECVSY